MKKFARVLALVLALAMMLSMTAFAAEKKTTWITVSIEDDEGVTAAKPYRVRLEGESSHYLTEQSPLSVEVVAIINEFYTDGDESTPLYRFQSHAMKEIMDEGLKAYVSGSDQKWADYVETYYSDVDPVAGQQSLKDLLSDKDSVLGDLVPNVAHKISFKNEVKNDEKYGVTYTVTVTRFTDVIPELDMGGEGHNAYVNGYPDGTVRPEATISRAEVAAIFYRAMTEESRAEFASTTGVFSDVAEGAWYNKAVSTLAAAGIIKGNEDGTFRPSAPITRAEIAAMAVRFTAEGRSLEGASYRGVFSDVEEGKWYAPVVELASGLGWVQGHDGKYRPMDNMTRAEVMTMVNRILERQVKAEDMLEGMIEWPDNTADKWYYEAVQEATNSHEYTRTEETVSEQDFEYEQWTALNN